MYQSYLSQDRPIGKIPTITKFVKRWRELPFLTVFVDWIADLWRNGVELE